MPAAPAGQVLGARSSGPPGRREDLVDEFYWERDPGAPFGLLIRIATACLHPEAEQLEELQLRARRPGDEEMRAFKAELRAAVSDPGQVPGDEMSRHVEYEDGSPGAFLCRLWRDLYGEEPPAAADGLFAPTWSCGSWRPASCWPWCRPRGCLCFAAGGL
jgi:hypothetical protein